MAKLPAQIDKYELVRRLGHGGMGTVYLGRDPGLDRLVAIKVLRDPLFDDELLQRFLREARAAANLRHENIITVYDVGEHDHQPFMAMEYVDGTSLAEVIRSRQPLTLDEKLSYIEQICSGLAFAHAQGIVHRDVKPANLMVDRRHIIRILDFGIARVEGSGMTRDGALIGTLSYMSPEQMLGRPIDHRSDIFAVGAVAYELLAYQQAFPGTLEDGLLQRLPTEDPPSLAGLCPGLPDGLEAIVMKALAKKPGERFADLDEARVALRDIRRRVSPELTLDPIVTRASARPGGKTPAPEGSGDRRDLMERRARQIAVHRSAARAALERQDLEGAAAACEDALTIDPDDAEALQLLAEIQQTRQRREEESKQRHERDRTLRQRLADAELKLSRGDIAGAAGLLQQVFAANAHDPGALALLPKVKAAATAASIEIPEILPAGVDATVLVDRRSAGSDSARLQTAGSDPTARVATVRVAQDAPPLMRRGVILAAVATAAVIAIGVTVWSLRGSSSETSTAAPTTVATTPAPAVETPSSPAPDVIPPSGGAAASSAPPSPVAAPADAAYADQLARVNTAYRLGDMATALRLIEPLLKDHDDDLTRGLVSRIAQTSREAMRDAETAASTLKASQLAPETFAAATRAKSAADRALTQHDYIVAGRQALQAAETFRRAGQEAGTAAVRVAQAPPPNVPAISPSPSPAPAQPPASTAAAAATPTSPPPLSAPAPSPAPPPAAAAANPTPSPSPSPAPAATVVPRPDTAILRALGRYQEAYRDLSVKALKEVYPNLPRETGQRLEKRFKDCRAFEVSFLSPQVSPVAGDPSAASVNVRSTYSCQPKNAQAAQSSSLQEIFLLRKIGEEWVIEKLAIIN